MSTAQTTCPELLFAPRRSLGREVPEPGLASRLSTLLARFAGSFESYDDYFAELERSLPMHVREQRRERQQSNHLLLIAALGR